VSIKDEDVPIADVSTFTISYPGLKATSLLEELIYYGISAIGLRITGSERYEGLRPAYPSVKRDRSCTEARLKKFTNNIPSRDHRPPHRIGILLFLVSWPPFPPRTRSSRHQRPPFKADETTFQSAGTGKR